MKKQLYFLILTTCFLFACEKNKHIKLLLIDKNTHAPLENVFVSVNAGYDGDYSKNHTEGYTNKHGQFETYMMIGCARGCYDIQINYSKSKYQFKEELNNTEGIIELEYIN